MTQVRMVRVTLQWRSSDQSYTTTLKENFYLIFEEFSLIKSSTQRKK